MYKFFKTGALCAALLLTAADAGAARRKPSKLSAGNIDEIVAAMTPEEKANLIVGMSRSFSEAERADVGYTERIVAGAAGTTYPVERLGITPVVFADGPAGVRIDPRREGDEKTYFCTGVPIGTLLAASWNDELVADVGAVIGNEAKEYGVDVLLAPGLNIMRNPLCGPELRILLRRSAAGRENRGGLCPGRTARRRGHLRQALCGQQPGDQPAGATTLA